MNRHPRHWIPQYRKIICIDCKQPYIYRGGPRVRCPDCSFISNSQNLLRIVTIAEKRVHRMADLSGNPKVWTSENYSQEFLSGLIPWR